MKQWFPAVISVLAALFLVAADGCGSDPNVEGAKLDLRNKDYERALDNINQALQSTPDNTEALYLKGDILSEMLPMVSDPDERSVYVSEMVRAYRRGVDLDPTWSSDVNRRLEIIYLTEFNAGIDVYDQAEQLPGRRRVQVFAESAQRFRNASEIFPDSGDAYINEAAAYYGAGQLTRAIDAYETALSLGHTHREIYIYLAKTYELLAEEGVASEEQPAYYGSMVRTLEAAMQSHPEDHELRSMLLNAYAFADLPEMALAFYERELPSERENKVFLYNYGTLMMREADYDGAISLLSSAVVLDSAYANAQFNLGAAYINKAVGVDAHFRAVDDTLQMQRATLPAFRRTQLEGQMQELAATRHELFHQAIVHLEAASRLLEDDVGEARDICRALYVAYAQTDQRSRAEALATCAGEAGY